MRRILVLVIVLIAAFSCGKPDPGVDFPMAVAHRGCWLKEGSEFFIPENCPAGVRMAAQYGYPAIECDVKYTRDSVMVLMHDGTINRTMRRAEDYSPIGEPVRVSDLDFEELRSGFVLASTDPSLRTPIPTLREELEACREYGIIPMLHSAVVESYKLASEILSDSWIAFDASETAVRQAREYSSCLILLDPGRTSAEDAIERIESIGGRTGVSTMKYDMLDSAFIAAVKSAGHAVQASIFPTPHEQRALKDGVTIELSDFYWHQTAGRKPSDTFRKFRMRLPEGQSVEWTPSAPEYSALTLEADFTGTLEIDVCGRVYTLTHGEGAETERLGLRLYKTDPALKVRALSHSYVKSLRAELYDCSPKD